MDRRASNGRRAVDTWLPIHGWTVAQVWARIAAAGTRVHPAYAAGMTRLSCVFCVLGSRADLVLSARLNPELATQFAEVERVTGHDFRTDLPMRTIRALAAADVSVQEGQAVAEQAPTGCPALFAEPRRAPAAARRPAIRRPSVVADQAHLFAEAEQAA